MSQFPGDFSGILPGVEGIFFVRWQLIIWFIQNVQVRPEGKSSFIAKHGQKGRLLGSLVYGGVD